MGDLKTARGEKQGEGEGLFNMELTQLLQNSLEQDPALRLPAENEVSFGVSWFLLGRIELN